MLTFIGCAKTISTEVPQLRLPALTGPEFQAEADRLAADLCTYSADELRLMLGINSELARLNRLRYQEYANPASPGLPAVLAYDGMVFKQLSAATLEPAALDYAANHLLIGSYLYGLLRPFDLIKPYRLEGRVELASTGYKPVSRHWRPLLTSRFIELVKTQGDGVLLNLASNEFRDIFDWKRVEREVKVVSPRFMVEREMGRLASVTIYAKMCRGAMARWVLANRITNPRHLEAFSHQGFEHRGDLLFSMLRLDG